MAFYEDYGSDFYLYHLEAVGNAGIMHIHPHWEMLLVYTEEKMNISVNAQVHSLVGPALFLFSPFCLHKVDFLDSSKQIDRFVCYFGDDTINAYPNIFGCYSNTFSKNYYFLPLTVEQAELCRQMIKQTALFELHGKEQKLLFLLMLCTLLIEDKNLDSSDSSVSTSTQLSRIIQYMQEHLAENIDADEVARQFYISRSKLDKDFQKYTDISFRQLLIQMRLSHAAYLLSFDRELKISDVAAMSGFENENYFNAQFKRFYGATPLKYQKNPKSYRYYHNG